MTLLNRLFDLQDKEYKDFQCRLMPTVDPARVIGVRVPALRKLAKEIHGSPEAEKFLTTLPHKYYEEDCLHGFLLEREKDYDKCVARLNSFLPYVDNWATCDMMSPKVFKKHPDRLLEDVYHWLKSDKAYTVRFAIGMLMRYFLDDNFDIHYPETVAGIVSQDYYINMMIAWYFATALAKQYETVLPFFEQRRLPVWVHNKAIQKAVESYRVCTEHKVYLKTLRIKGE